MKLSEMTLAQLQHRYFTIEERYPEQRSDEEEEMMQREEEALRHEMCM